ncbi:hypothetical protein HDN1F_02310 [gamma proteobacterium HdN1]|nr:hypothetical protein HDN1F_02310 [gamma proteobacterium HdN1]
MQSFVRRYWLPLLTLVAIIVGSLLPLRKWVPSYLETDLTNAAHYPSGVLLGLLLAPYIQRNWRRALLVAAIGSAAFGAIEVLQPFFGRFQSMDDWIKSSSGMVIGVAATFVRFSTPRWVIAALGGVALVLFAIFVLPLVQTLRTVAAYEQRFPVLADFERWDDFLIWRTTGHSFYDRRENTAETGDAASAARGAYHAAVRRRSEGQPGVAVDNVVVDWRAYRELCFDSRASAEPGNASAPNQALEVLLADNRDGGIWHERFPNPAYWHTVCISLDGLKAADGSPLNLAHISQLRILGSKVAAGQGFDLDRVYLR